MASSLAVPSSPIDQRRHPSSHPRRCCSAGALPAPVFVWALPLLPPPPSHPLRHRRPSHPRRYPRPNPFRRTFCVATARVNKTGSVVAGVSQSFALTRSRSASISQSLVVNVSTYLALFRLAFLAREPRLGPTATAATASRRFVPASHRSLVRSRAWSCVVQVEKNTHSFIGSFIHPQSASRRIADGSIGEGCRRRFHRGVATASVLERVGAETRRRRCESCGC